MVEFSERLKALMGDRDMSAAELSRLSGLGQTVISFYLHGQRRPNYVSLAQIRRALGCSWEDLLG